EINPAGEKLFFDLPDKPSHAVPRSQGDRVRPVPLGLHPADLQVEMGGGGEDLGERPPCLGQGQPTPPAPQDKAAERAGRFSRDRWSHPWWSFPTGLPRLAPHHVTGNLRRDRRLPERI